MAFQVLDQYIGTLNRVLLRGFVVGAILGDFVRSITPTSLSDPASSIGGPKVVPTIARPTYVKPTPTPSEYATERVGIGWSG